MEEEELRSLWGQVGDYSPTLAAIFGEAYLNGSDEASQNIPDGLLKTAEGGDLRVYEVGILVGRAIESARVINCRQNQLILTAFILAFIKDWATGFPHSVIWENIKHMESCYNPDCCSLDSLARMDKHLTQEQMKARFEHLSLSYLPED